MPKITEQELREYFLKNDGTILNKEKVKISLRNEDIFCIDYLLEEDKEEYHRYELYDEVRGAKNFIEVFNLQRVEDLQHISRSNLWIRFLGETAEVIFTNGDANSINFRLLKGKTMVYSLDLNYYTEVMRVMNMTEHFKEFIRENIEELEEMSYKRG